jgi:hypothetical protein
MWEARGALAGASSVTALEQCGYCGDGFEAGSTKTPILPGGSLGKDGRVWCVVLFEACGYACELTVAAAVTAAAVSAATTVEAATAYCAAVESAADRYM